MVMPKGKQYQAPCGAAYTIKGLLATGALALALCGPVGAENSKAGAGGSVQSSPSAGAGSSSSSTRSSSITRSGAATRDVREKSSSSDDAPGNVPPSVGTRSEAADDARSAVGNIEVDEPTGGVRNHPDGAPKPDPDAKRDPRFPDALRSKPNWGAENNARQQNWDAYTDASGRRYYRSRFVEPRPRRGIDDRDHDGHGRGDHDGRDDYRRYYYPAYVPDYWMNPYVYYYDVEGSSATYSVTERPRNGEDQKSTAGSSSDWEIVPVEEPIDGEFVEVFHPAVYREGPAGKTELLEEEKTTREPKVKVILTRRWVGEGAAPAESGVTKSSSSAK